MSGKIRDVAGREETSARSQNKGKYNKGLGWILHFARTALPPFFATG